MRLGFALLLGVASCGRAAALDRPRPAPILVLGDASVVSVVIEAGGAPHRLTLAADGRLRADDREVAALAADGALSIDGAVVLRLAADGAITDAGGRSAGERLVVRADGALVANGEVVVAVTTGGALAGPLVAAGPRFVVSGAPQTRRAMMFGWLAVMARGAVVSWLATLAAGTRPATAPP